MPLVVSSWWVKSLDRIEPHDARRTILAVESMMSSYVCLARGLQAFQCFWHVDLSSRVAATDVLLVLPVDWP